MEKQVKIKIVDITGNTMAQIENAFNNTYSAQRWRIVQIFVIGAKQYILAQKEV